MSKCSKVSIVMVGAFPPPVHGMATINASVYRHLDATGAKLEVIDLASELDRSLISRIRKGGRVIYGLLRIARRKGLVGATFYSSISGGLGQLYEVLFLLVARLRRMHIYVHHHSFAYVDNFSRITALLVWVAGRDATHITLSSSMAVRLVQSYPAIKRALPISNAVFLGRDADMRRTRVRSRVRTLGYLSNISAEKGIFTFLDLLAEARGKGLSISGRIAGPFRDTTIEQEVRARLAELTDTTYVGPVYGLQRETFFADIDVFLFPTEYINEAEPLVIHEAMSRGIPVIAYGRGAIPEIVGGGGGVVVRPDMPFVPAALQQIMQWLSASGSFQTESTGASECFWATYATNLSRWNVLMEELLGANRNVLPAEKQ